jgi:hypothetical protein
MLKPNYDRDIANEMTGSQTLLINNHKVLFMRTEKDPSTKVTRIVGKRTFFSQCHLGDKVFNVTGTCGCCQCGDDFVKGETVT